MSGRAYDFAVIGAGIVGAAVAAELLRRRPGLKLVVIEKEAAPAFHQTGRNSGVVHSGVYYKPGSLKATLCREGLERTQAFCLARGIGYEARGKLLVATDDVEETRLSALVERAAQNGVVAEPLSGKELRRLEPKIAGQAALRIAATAIVDYTGVTRSLLGDVENAGGEVAFSHEVLAIKRIGSAYRLEARGTCFEAGQVVACCGLAADRIARMAGIDPGIRIVPFRGEYYVLPQQHAKIVHHLIYPVPDPALPFLGVHLTPMIDGAITVGPNAVLALAREGYSRWSVNAKDAGSALLYPGLWRLLARHRRAMMDELRGSLSKRAYLKAVRKYCPAITLADLAQYRSANRAQAVLPDGTMLDDFLIRSEEGFTAVLNAPSPAATSAMPIADKICNQISC